MKAIPASCVLLVLFGLGSPAAAQPVTFTPPPVSFEFNGEPRLFLNDDTYARALANISSSDPYMQQAWARVEARANRALELDPIASAYVGASLAEFSEQGGGTFQTAQHSGLRYRLTNNAADGRRAADFLLAWSRAQSGSQIVLEPPTANSYGDAPGLGLLMAHVAVPAANAYVLAYPAMTPDERGEVETWLRYLVNRVEEGRANWVATNPVNGRTYFNDQYMSNHLSYHNAAFAAVGLALQDEAITMKAFSDPGVNRDFFNMLGGAILMADKPDWQIFKNDKSDTALDGEIYDRYRTNTGKGLGYSMLHLNLLQSVAEMAYINGVDVLDFEGPSGESLTVAFHHLEEYLLQNSVDPYGTGYYSHPDEQVPYLISPLYRWALLRYPDDGFDQVVLASPDFYDGTVFGLGAHLLLLNGSPTVPEPASASVFCLLALVMRRPRKAHTGGSR